MKRSSDSLQLILSEALRLHSNKKASSIYRKKWSSFTYKDIIGLSSDISKKILALDLPADSKVAVILDSCPEYAAAFFGAGLSGRTTLLIDTKLGPNEMKQIFDHADASVIITGFDAKVAAEKLNHVLGNKIPVINIEEMGAEPRSIADLEAEIKSFSGIQHDDLALLVYTSGTTSEPKGVMLTLSNVITNSRQSTAMVIPHDDGTFLSILPLNHMLEFCGGLIIPFLQGSHVVYANTIFPHEIMDRLKAFRYTDMIVVPLFLRAMMSSITKNAHKNPYSKAYFESAMALARVVPSQQVRRLMFFPVVKKLGGMKRFICGGAALDVRSQEFFTLLGITVTQGYGLTETSPISTVTPTGSKIFGSPGKALPGVEVKIDPESGEILIRGPHVMKGYYKELELTKNVLTEDGWFKTGDIGRLDTEGNLFITGRIKEMIVLGNGKKVYPDEVEASLKMSLNIKEVVIVGAEDTSGQLKDTESVCAVIIPSDDIRKIHTDGSILKLLLEKEIKKMTQELAAYKRPSRFYLFYDELPKTSTRKNKRNLIKKMIMEGAFA